MSIHDGVSVGPDIANGKKSVLFVRSGERHLAYNVDPLLTRPHRTGTYQWSMPGGQAPVRCKLVQLWLEWLTGLRSLVISLIYPRSVWLCETFQPHTLPLIHAHYRCEYVRASVLQSADIDPQMRQNSGP